MRIKWQNLSEITPEGYDCGHCGKHTGPNKGYSGQYQVQGQARNVYTYICTYCNRPTYFDADGRQVPGVAPGNPVEALPAGVASLYEEARQCIAANAPTASVMACRKILMNVAVDQGADGNKSYAHYVDWLDDQGYISPGGKGWVKLIKDVGNEANHEIPDISTDKAKRVLTFTEGFLKFVYEFPAAAGDTGEAVSPVEQPT